MIEGNRSETFLRLRTFGYSRKFENHLGGWKAAVPWGFASSLKLKNDFTAAFSLRGMSDCRLCFG